MTATNHMLTGAVLAVSVQRLWLMAPMAIISHFVLDVLPHFGVHKDDTAKRNKHPLFQYIVFVDVALAISLLVLLPSILSGAVSTGVLLFGMLLAYSPDLIWVHRFMHEIRKKTVQYKPSWLTKFHHEIQWGERTWGVAVELVFFAGMGVWLGVLST